MFRDPRFLIAICVLTSAAGQLSMKLGMQRIGLETMTKDPPVAILVRAVQVPEVLLGLGLYAIGAASWLLVLSRAQLSYAYPLLGSIHILIVVGSAVFLGESVSLVRYVGATLIALGIWLVASS